MSARPALIIALALCLVTGPRGALADGLVYSTSEQIHADAIAGPCDDKERFDAVVALFKKMGARDEEISDA